MYLEFRHLRTIRAIHEAGGLARAADMLHITQSALSHQVKALEEQVGMELFHRRSKPMKLSPAGLKLLRLAERILPEISAVEEEFRAMQSGRSGRLHIAIECHACFDWLFPVLDGLRSAWPDVDVDIRMRLAFDAIEALRREEVDFVISSDPVSLPGITFQPLFDYEPMFVCPRGHRLAEKPFIEAEDFAEETLLHYPVERAKLDIFTQLLTPARVEPRGMRPVELTEVILMLVAAGRGVTVLPDWVLRDVRARPDYVVKHITEGGLTKRMYAAVRDEDTAKPYIAHMIRLARTEPVKLQRG
ncbi:LysR family transcriptional regulator [Maritimibacter sp. HL-12]|uniref:LysR family transcriptional regulator n=1 Tax=Maritimibacter sp. HL-12 TaxID=1162418 RepID=UPI000A0F31F7|nr:LysR family transcriptional regulator [Maritimibacter sp. HL-12]SMH32208.1 LysR family transcriptional regulator, regulator for metE and metH [Maritimibacter sp. HL-12]